MVSEYINCVDCSEEFEYSERDQEFYRERGFSNPKRCKACRTKKKDRFKYHGREHDSHSRDQH